MALPVSPAPKSDDVAVRGWTGITVRIAWTLLARGVKVRPQVLNDARQHALFHIEPHRSLCDAEDMAAALTEGFVNRARGLAGTDPWPQDMHLSVSRRWRRAIERSLTPQAEAVFRKHYGDNRSLTYLAQRLKVDRLVLETARAGLREVVRRAAALDDVPIDQWPPERLDRLLVRLAAHSPGPCPPLLDVVEGGYREHVLGCARCDRTVRMVRASILSVEDLLPPTLGARPRGTVQVLALHFHPDGRHHMRALRQEIEAQVCAVGDDLLLVDAQQPEPVSAVLQMAAEVATPHRDHLRGLVLEGPGAWSRHGLLGPLAERASQEVGQRLWGTLDGLGELPEPLPEPPSARPIWFTVFALLCVGLALLQVAVSPPPPDVDLPMEVVFSEGRGGVWVAFDVPEEGVVSLVGLDGGGLSVIHQGKGPADKVAFAVGDGTYRVHVPGDGVLAVIARRPLDLERLMAQASVESSPLERLGRLIAEVEPRADWHVHRR